MRNHGSVCNVMCCARAISPLRKKSLLLCINIRYSSLKPSEPNDYNAFRHSTAFLGKSKIDGITQSQASFGTSTSYVRKSADDK